MSVVELAVLKLLDCGNDFHICFLWASGRDNWETSSKLFTKVAFEKVINLSMNGAINLLYECYSHMDWVGSEKTKFSGLRQKLAECFPGQFVCKVIVFQEKKGLDEVRKIKEKVRSINNIGFSSIHITDTKAEVLRLSPLILNSNAFHFMNSACPVSFRLAVTKVSAIKNELISCGVALQDSVVDGALLWKRMD